MWVYNVCHYYCFELDGRMDGYNEKLFHASVNCSALAAGLLCGTDKLLGWVPQLHVTVLLYRLLEYTVACRCTHTQSEVVIVRDLVPILHRVY